MGNISFFLKITVEKDKVKAFKITSKFENFKSCFELMKNVTY